MTKKKILEKLEELKSLHKKGHKNTAEMLRSNLCTTVALNYGVGSLYAEVANVFSEKCVENTIANLAFAFGAK